MSALQQSLKLLPQLSRESELKDETTLKLAAPEATAEALTLLGRYDRSAMLTSVFEMPKQIIEAENKSHDYHAGDPPLDRSKIHLVGLGGSAIAGELLRDMVSPKKVVSVHRGTRPPRDKAGVIVSSYSGNTRDILDLSHLVTGGLRTVVYFASGGLLEQLGFESSIPVWKMPAGYQPRAAVGWSMALVAAVADRWGVNTGLLSKLIGAADRLNTDLTTTEAYKQPLVRAALPLATALNGRTAVIFHSLRCTGTARRLAAQINENAKQPAFVLVMPEALHNGVEGLLGSSEAGRWCLIFMYDQEDTPSLKEAMHRSEGYFSGKGFVCFNFPAIGNDAFELTLSRVFIADMVSLFLAARRGIDPTPIPGISEMKQLEPPYDPHQNHTDQVEFH